jgi:hypothetical protein
MVGIALALMVLFVSGFGLCFFVQDHLRFRGGRTVRVVSTVTVTEDFVDNDGEADNQSTLSFKDEAGRAVSVTGRAGGGRWSPGTKVELIYPEGRPKFARPAFGTAERILFGLCAALFFGAALYLPFADWGELSRILG